MGLHQLFIYEIDNKRRFYGHHLFRRFPCIIRGTLPLAGNGLAGRQSGGYLRMGYREIPGKIPQVRHTYNVVGNMNEHQLAIGETTYGGRHELSSQQGAIIDYGSLIYLTLQRAKNAREAILVMTDLVEEYGYASEGESFSISDPNEVWIMEMIGKGEGEKGAVWVARMVPDGYICAHANQARITTFPLEGRTSISSEK